MRWRKLYYCALRGAEFCAPPFLTDEKLPDGIIEAAFEWLEPTEVVLTTSPLLTGAAFFFALGFLLLLMYANFQVKIQLNALIKHVAVKNVSFGGNGDRLFCMLGLAPACKSAAVVVLRLAVETKLVFLP